MDLFKTIQEDARARFRSSLLISFFFSVCVLNWKVFYYLGFDTGAPETKFDYFDKYTTLQTLFCYPLLFAVLIAIVVPFLEAAIHRVVSTAKNWMLANDQKAKANRAFDLEDLKLDNDGKIHLKKIMQESKERRLTELDEMRSRIKAAKVGRVEVQAIQDSDTYKRVEAELQQIKGNNVTLEGDLELARLRALSQARDFSGSELSTDHNLISALEHENYWDEMTQETIELLSLVKKFGPEKWVPLSAYVAAFQKVSTEEFNFSKKTLEERNNHYHARTRELLQELDSNGSIKIVEDFDEEGRVKVRIRPLGVLAMMEWRKRSKNL